MNPLAMVPARVRLWLYGAYALLGLAVASVATYCTATSRDVPDWSIGVAAVLAGPLATVFGGLAASNVSDRQTVAVSVPGTTALTANVDATFGPADDRPPPPPLTETLPSPAAPEGGYSAAALIVGVVVAVFVVVVVAHALTR